MRYGVLGTGAVGRALAGRLVEVGHEVRMGSRTPDNEAAAAWAAEAGANASNGTFADAAEFGQAVLNCTNGTAALDALAAAGDENLSGKVLIDVTNPLTFETGRLTLTVCNTDSLGEQIQRAHPEARVVKTLNTMANEVMIHPEQVPGRHLVFVSGDDAEAKQHVAGMLESFGWPPESIVDLGGIETARGTEMFLVLWISMMQAFGDRTYNINVVRPD
ncbi:MAG TPA: NAD(P)-binding domain-containing protein [Gaiellales bacterium]|nr:NAD(P)-binding domain-containing protein [Gaiellales bacterium]